MKTYLFADLTHRASPARRAEIARAAKAKLAPVMAKERMERLKAKGWRSGSAADFLAPQGAGRMTMHNPPHPGEFIAAMYLEPHGISGRQLAAKLNVAPSTLNRLLLGTSAVSPEMALRLAKTLGRSPESWLSLQQHYDLWQARRRVDLADVSPLKFPTD